MVVTTRRNITTRRRTEEIAEQVNPGGEIVGGQGQTTQPGSPTMRFTLTRRRAGQSAVVATITFIEGSQTFLTMSTTINQTTKTTSFRASGQGVQVEYRIDLSRAASTATAAVSGRANGQPLRGT